MKAALSRNPEQGASALCFFVHSTEQDFTLHRGQVYLLVCVSQIAQKLDEAEEAMLGLYRCLRQWSLLSLLRVEFCHVWHFMICCCDLLFCFMLFVFV